MNKLILVVDDSSTMRKFVAFALEMKGYRVLPAVDGMDALEKLSENVVDLAIIDLNMPIMDGFELLRNIRASEDYADLPTIILSSEQSNKSKSQGETLGADAYLIKPFDAIKIQDEVAKYLTTSARHEVGTD